MSRVNYTNIENGKRNLTADNVVRLAKLFEVTADVILGNEVRETDEESLEISREKKPKAKKTKIIPVLGRVPAGYPNTSIEYILDYEEVTEDIYKLGELFGLVISGDSMEPDILEGDVAIVLQTNIIPSGKIGVIRINGDDVTVKKVMLQPDGIDLVPTNKKYGTLHFTDKEVEDLPVTIIGRLVEIRRKIDLA